MAWEQRALRLLLSLQTSLHRILSIIFPLHPKLMCTVSTASFPNNIAWHYPCDHLIKAIMDKRVKQTIVICDTDLDHSFTMEGFLRNENYDVVNITDATELIATTKSLRPSVVFVNPEMKGFNEDAVCETIMKSLGIPLILLLEGNSTHRAQVGQCQADDVITKPNGGNNLL